MKRRLVLCGWSMLAAAGLLAAAVSLAAQDAAKTKPAKKKKQTAKTTPAPAPSAGGGADTTPAPAANYKVVGDTVIIDERFLPKGPNLVPNGDFAKGDKFPDHWEPVPPHVDWIDTGGQHGKAIHFNVPREVARVYGVKYLSDYIDVQPNHTYLCSFDCKKTGGLEMKVFLEGYAEIGGARRQIYRADITPYPKTKGQWERQGRREPFSMMHPSGQQVKWLRVKLYAYGGDTGEVWWDNIHIEEVVVTPEDNL